MSSVEREKKEKEINIKQNIKEIGFCLKIF